MKLKGANIFFITLGILLFYYSINIFGSDSLEILSSNFEIKYLGIYIFVTLLAVLPLVWRWDVILRAYGHKVSFIGLLRMQLAGYAISYITPSARYGGEPLRVYMLKKESGIDYKTGTASVVLDKYIEYFGAVTFGMIGLVLMFFIPDLPLIMRYGLFGLIVLCVVTMGYIFYRLQSRKGFFFSIVKIFVNKPRLRKMSSNLKDVDSKLSDFIINYRKYFFYSYLFYVMSAFFFLVEFKYLLLAFGVTSTSLDVILIVVVIGIANLAPTPMALGAMEAGQTGLFQVLMGSGSIGLLLSLVHRARGMAISAIGFVVIIFFGGKDLLKKSKEVKG